MKKEIPTQLIVGLGILLIGGGVLGGEFYLVKWLPRHREQVKAETLRPIPYKNEKLGIEMQIAAGLFGQVEEFAGGVRITRPKFMSIGPSITITSQPNPDGTFEFDPKALAKWQTDDLYQQLSRYRYSRTRINNRDAVLISQYRDRAMVLTARVISSERLIEISCNTGREDEDLYLQACEGTARTLKVAGPEPPPPAQFVIELTSPTSRIK
jgi:hypothetical protein